MSRATETTAMTMILLCASDPFELDELEDVEDTSTGSDDGS